MARTYTVTENTNSRKMQIQTPGAGSSVFSYEFNIRPTSGTAGTVNEEYQAAYTALRTYLGTPIGKLTDISAYSSSPFGALGSVRSINMEIEPGSDHVYRYYFNCLLHTLYRNIFITSMEIMATCKDIGAG